MRAHREGSTLDDALARLGAAAPVLSAWLREGSVTEPAPPLCAFQIGQAFPGIPDAILLGRFDWAPREYEVARDSTVDPFRPHLFEVSAAVLPGEGEVGVAAAGLPRTLLVEEHPSLALAPGATYDVLSVHGRPVDPGSGLRVGDPLMFCRERPPERGVCQEAGCHRAGFTGTNSGGTGFLAKLLSNPRLGLDVRHHMMGR